MSQSSDPALRRPRAADIAFGLSLAAAACILVFGALVPLQIGPALDRTRQEATARHIPLATLQQQLVVVAVVIAAIAVVLAGLLVLFAFRFRAGRRRARLGLVVVTFLLVLTLYVPALLVAVVMAAADVLAYLRPTSAWLQAAERARTKAI